MRKIICYEKKVQAIIQMETGLKALLLIYSFVTTPFTVTVGQSSLSHIFAVFENYVFVITIDWNSEVEGLSTAFYTK